MERVVLHKEYRQAWAQAGYVDTVDGVTDCRMGSAEICLPPPPSLLRVYHLASSAFAISNIALRRLKVARLAELNDPFEFMWVMWRHLNLRDKAEEWKRLYNHLLGFLCFSQDWTNPVLWSHYADNHRGVCLGFDVPRSDAIEVSYEAKRLDLQLPDNVERLSEELERQLLYTKFEDWRYEREVRLKASLDDLPCEGTLRFCGFSERLMLREVILGDQCPVALATVRQLTAPMIGAPITFRARLAGKHYKVVPDVRRPDEPESADAV